ncbi:unnamed protein product [Symbiodinium sp. CCMP2592]|nr:unnamed protein product [Symbiodinium sp. CCMP2592]
MQPLKSWTDKMIALADSTNSESAGSSGQTCKALGCTRPTFDGFPGYCSRTCRNRDKICRAVGCERPTYDGQPGYCSKSCRDSETAGSTVLEPKSFPFKWTLYEKEKSIGVCAFYFPGYETAWDKDCGCSFLGNFYPASISLTIRGKSTQFRNAEAAFQACKFPARASEFASCDGWQAFRLRSDCAGEGEADARFGGFGSNWRAMRAVLMEKFKDRKLREALLKTGDCFLLEHNERVGRDEFWSDNGNGTGVNALGLQLMLIREDLLNAGGATRWTRYLKDHVEQGDSIDVDTAWRQLVRAASAEVRQQVLRRTLPEALQKEAEADSNAAATKFSNINIEKEGCEGNPSKLTSTAGPTLLTSQATNQLSEWKMPPATQTPSSDRTVRGQPQRQLQAQEDYGTGTTAASHRSEGKMSTVSEDYRSGTTAANHRSEGKMSTASETPSSYSVLGHSQQLQESYCNGTAAANHHSEGKIQMPASQAQWPPAPTPKVDAPPAYAPPPEADCGLAPMDVEAQEPLMRSVQLPGHDTGYRCVEHRRVVEMLPSLARRVIRSRTTAVRSGPFPEKTASSSARQWRNGNTGNPLVQPPWRR